MNEYEELQILRKEHSYLYRENKRLKNEVANLKEDIARMKSILNEITLIDAKINELKNRRR